MYMTQRLKWHNGVYCCSLVFPTWIISCGDVADSYQEGGFSCQSAAADGPRRSQADASLPSKRWGPVPTPQDSNLFTPSLSTITRGRTPSGEMIPLAKEALMCLQSAGTATAASPNKAQINRGRCLGPRLPFFSPSEEKLLPRPQLASHIVDVKRPWHEKANGKFFRDGLLSSVSRRGGSRSTFI